MNVAVTHGGSGFLPDFDVKVREPLSTFFVIANPDGTQNTCLGYDPDAKVVFTGFTAGRAADNGSGFPSTHTANPLQSLTPADKDGHGCVVTLGDGSQVLWQGKDLPFTFDAPSVKDLGVYHYQITGTTGDPFGNTSPIQNDVFDITVKNNAPTANPSVSGTLKVGNTITFNAAASDPDGGAVTFNWVVTVRPPGSTANLASPTTASPTMHLADKHDIGDWTVEVDVVDAQGELKKFTKSFQVVNQPPTLTITPASPVTINALEHIHLQAGPATDADGETVTWVWDIVSAPPTAANQPQSGFSTSQTIDFVTGPHDIGAWSFKCTAKDEHGATVDALVSVTVKAVPPKINIPNDGIVIKVGTPINFATTILDDAYGDPLQFTWDIVQVPVPAGIGLVSAYSSTASINIPTTDSSAGTWKLKLTVKDQVNQTAEQTVSVVVDAPPVAKIVGPDQTGNLTLPLDLDGSQSIDPDTDVMYLCTIPPPLNSGGITTYQWSIVDGPPALGGACGPVSDVFGVADTGSTLHIPAGKLSVGHWLFELKVVDAEGNPAIADQAVEVLDQKLAPIAIISPPAIYNTDVSGALLSDIVVDGSLSFDLDNLLNTPFTLGITDYSWSILNSPSSTVPPPVNGPGLTSVKLFSAGQIIGPSELGIYTVGLTVTDDDMPAMKGVNSTLIMIGNCPGAICIDYPTSAAKKYIKFSDKTDVLIYYHLNSLLYAVPDFAYGLRLQMDIYHESDLVTPAFNQSWAVDLLPSDKGGYPVMHWSGFDNNGQRPKPGKYNLVLQLLDKDGNITGYSASEPDSIQIQTLDVSVDPATDKFVSCNGLAAGTDKLSVKCKVTGDPAEDMSYDELHYRIYDKGTDIVVYEDSVFGASPTSFTWDGNLGGIFLDPGEYDLELEILDGGSSLGRSPRYVFDAYKVTVKLDNVVDADTLTPGGYVAEGATNDMTVLLEGEIAALPGNVTIKTEDEPGTLAGIDGTTPFDIDAGADFPSTSFSPTAKTFHIKGLAPGSTGKTTFFANYQPPGMPATKAAKARAALTVVRGQVRAVSSNPDQQQTNGIFVAGQNNPVVVTPLNFDQLKYQMRPTTVHAQPDIAGATVTLDFDSGTAANVEFYLADPLHAQITLPKSWTAVDFNAHKLDVPLLAYGKSYGDVVLKLTYANGANVYATEKLKIRVQPFPGAVGVDIPGQYPFFRGVRTVNAGSPVKTALDPVRHHERVGASAAIYLVAHKTPAQWAADPSLTDVTGGPKMITLADPSIQNNIVSLGAPGAGAYDVVYDFGNFPDKPAGFATDGKLDPGDILDSAQGGPSAVVEASFTAAGPSATTTFIYGMVAPATTPVSAGYDGLSKDWGFRLRGQIIYPNVMPGPTPLIVIAHGNHTPLNVFNGVSWVTVSSDLTSDENFKGYTYLQQFLASRGYITVSVDLDEMYGPADVAGPGISTSGIKLRGWITLKNIEKILSDPAIAGGALVGKLDASQIYLMGHSRGGEAVLVAYDLLKNAGDRPAGGTLAGFTDASIKGIVSISPVTAAVESGVITPPPMPFLLLYGSADGDVNGAMSGVEPFRHYDRATGDKYAVRIEGGNHNNFNTSWAYSDASEAFTGSVITGSKSPLATPVGNNLVSGPLQRDFALGYVGAFMAMVQGGDASARDYFLEPPTRLRPLGVDVTLNLYGQARLQTGVTKAVLDDYEAHTGDMAVSSSGNAVTTTATGGSEPLLQDPGVNNLDETEAFNRFFQDTHGVLFDWVSPADYTESIGAGDQDLRGSRVISFRIAQQPKHVNTLSLAGPMSLTVELEDAAAKTSAVDIQVLDTVPGIYTAQLTTGMGLLETTSAAFKTFRIPTAAFVADGRDIDLAHIAKVRIKLGTAPDSAKGRVAVDDLEIEK